MARTKQTARKFIIIIITIIDVAVVAVFIGRNLV